MFRTGDAFGITKIYLTGYTPTPVDRFKRPVSRIAKTALGAEKTVSWEKVEVAPLIEQLRAGGVSVIALEQAPHAVPLHTLVRDPGFEQKGWALLVGNEVEGVDPETLALVDSVVEIPMRGTKESLNVAVAAGIALFTLSQVRD